MEFGSKAFNELMETEEGRRIYQRERLAIEMTELLCRVMENEGYDGGKLSRALRKGPWYIKQVLQNKYKPSLDEWADIFLAMNMKINVSANPVDWGV